MAKEHASSSATTPGDDDEALVCATCGYAITSRAARIEQQGAHEHTFVNPGGVVHHLGCFAVAPGARDTGASYEAFSWFPGWSWQIAACGRCHAHVGWHYRCAEREFHGLITAALR